MLCANCGSKRAGRKLVTQTYGQGRSVLMIEKVPAISCRDCGEEYFDAETTLTLEALRRKKRSMYPTRQVAVASFAAAG